VVTFWRQSEQVKGRVVVEEEVLRVAGLGADDVRALNWVAAEEDREVQSHDIIISLSSVQLDRKTSGVASLIRKLATQSDRGEPHKSRSLLTRALQEVGLGQVRNIRSSLEVSKSSRAARVNHTLEVLRAVEGLLLLHEVDVGHHGNTTDSLAMRWVRHRDALVVGEVWRIVFSFATFRVAGHFADDVHGAFVGGHHVRGAWRAAFWEEGADGAHVVLVDLERDFVGERTGWQ
jgi:hypothetical protein